jgi:hypothetical protein
MKLNKKRLILLLLLAVSVATILFCIFGLGLPIIALRVISTQAEMPTVQAIVNERCEGNIQVNPEGFRDDPILSWEGSTAEGQDVACYKYNGEWICRCAGASTPSGP